MLRGLSLVLNAFDVFAGSRVDLDDIAFIHENRSLEFSACFNFDRFSDISRCVSLGARFAIVNPYCLSDNASLRQPAQPITRAARS